MSEPTLIQQTDGAEPTPTDAGGSDEPSLKFAELLGDDGNTFREDADFASLGDYSGFVSKYKSIPDMLEGVKNLSKLASGKSQGVVPPTPDSDSGTVEAWRKALGVPDTPEGYGVKKPDEIPEGIEWNEEQVGEYLTVLHKHHAPPALVKELLDANMALETQRLDKFQVDSQYQREEALVAEQKKLEDEFGLGTATVLKKAQKAAAAIGLDATKSPLFTSAENVKAFAKMADLVGEDQLPNDISDTRKVAYEEAMDIMNGRHHLSESYYKGDPATVKKVTDGLKARPAGV
jgi:hypothetical protein